MRIDVAVFVAFVLTRGRGLLEFASMIGLVPIRIWRIIIMVL